MKLQLTTIVMIPESTILRKAKARKQNTFSTMTQMIVKSKEFNKNSKMKNKSDKSK